MKELHVAPALKNWLQVELGESMCLQQERQEPLEDPTVSAYNKFALNNRFNPRTGSYDFILSEDEYTVVISWVQSLAKSVHEGLASRYERQYLAGYARDFLRANGFTA